MLYKYNYIVKQFTYDHRHDDVFHGQCHVSLKNTAQEGCPKRGVDPDDRSTMVISLALNAANLQTLLSLQPFSHLELQPEDVLCSKLLSD